MTATSPNTLGRALRGFFADHLPRVRGASPHTVRSYRDTFVLLLRFVATRKDRSVPELDVDHVGPQEVLDFLHDLEVERHNLAATRNVRLAAIDRSTTDGRRDYALLASMFNTGARVQEIVALRVADLRVESPPHLRLFGKGRKERICPLWSQTADLLRALLVERSQPRADQPLFVNHRTGPLTRFGVRYILAKYCTQAREAMPTLATKRLHPHSMRHSTAVHLLRSGVDIVTISQWLGHVSITTTNRYTTVDLEMKRKAIEQARPIDHSTATLALWRTDASILTWLETL